jgi:hypothetical protein
MSADEDPVFADKEAAAIDAAAASLVVSSLSLPSRSSLLLRRLRAERLLRSRDDDGFLVTRLDLDRGLGTDDEAGTDEETGLDSCGLGVDAVDAGLDSVDGEGAGLGGEADDVDETIWAGVFNNDEDGVDAGAGRSGAGEKNDDDEVWADGPVVGWGISGAL